MWHPLRQKVAAVLICIFISVYKSTGELTEHENSRTKRQVPSDNDNFLGDVSSHIATELTTSTSQVSLDPSSVLIEAPLTVSEVESSSASDISAFSSENFQLTKSSTLWNEETSTTAAEVNTQIWPSLWSTNNINATTTFLPSDFLSEHSTFSYQATFTLPSDLLPSDRSVHDESSAVIKLDSVPSNSYFVDESSAVLQTDLLLPDNILFNTSTIALISHLLTDNNVLYESTTILPSDLLSGTNFVYESAIILPSDLLSDTNVVYESTTILPSDLLSDTNVVYESTTILPSDLLFDTNVVYESTTILPSDLLSDSNDFYEPSNVLPADSLSSYNLFVYESQSNFPQSDISLLEEFTIILPSDILSNSNLFVQSTTELPSHEFALDTSLINETSTILPSDLFQFDSENVAQSSIVLPSDQLSSDIGFFDNSRVILSSDIFPSASNSFDMSTTYFSEDLSMLTNESTLLLETITDSMEPTTMVIETPDLSVSSTEILESAVSNTDNIEPPSQSVYVSESFTPNIVGSSLLDDLSAPLTMTSFLNLTADMTVTPITTPDIQTILTTAAEQDTATMISLTATTTFTHETAAAEITPSESGSADASSLLESTAPSNTTPYNTAEITPSESSITDASSLLESTAPSNTTPYNTAEITPSESSITDASSLLESTASPSTTPNNTAENLPEKSSSSKEGLTTGGKIALGILIPVAVICLILFGLFFYRRYRSSNRNLKTFMHPSVRYRTYSNAAYKDDEMLAVDGTWRSLSDH